MLSTNKKSMVNKAAPGSKKRRGPTKKAGPVGPNPNNVSVKVGAKWFICLKSSGLNPRDPLGIRD